MRLTIKYLFLLGLFPATAQAAAKLTLLDVQGDVVYFSSAESKTAGIPACVSPENSTLYSLSLTHDSGKAMYAMLMTAMSSGNALDITSAGDCGAVDGFERASAIKFAQVAVSAKDFSGTILENVKELKYPFVNSIGENSNQHKTFFNWFVANGKQRRYGHLSKSTPVNRHNIGRKNEGSGWLTAIILPELNFNTKYTIDVHIDGVQYSFTGVSQHYPQFGGRVYMGVAAETGSYDNQTKVVYKYPEAATVVSMGQGVPFYQSIDVFLSLDSGTLRGANAVVANYLAYDILYGNPSPQN